MSIQLGSMLVDTKKVRVDKRLYFQMEKYNNATNLECCPQAWKEQGINAALASLRMRSLQRSRQR
jgi:hypothetical protein